jgi:hypothetical protein
VSGGALCNLCGGPYDDAHADGCPKPVAGPLPPARCPSRWEGTACELPAGHTGLRAVVSLYSEAYIEAVCAYYAAPHKGPAHACTLERQARLHEAASLLTEVWAQHVAGCFNMTIDQRLEHMTHLFGEDDVRAPWLRIVAADVRARLRGDMGREIPAVAS